jgi:hypothetical protein
MRNYGLDFSGQYIMYAVEKCVPNDWNKFEGCEPDINKIEKFLERLSVNIFSS